MSVSVEGRRSLFFTYSRRDDYLPPESPKAAGYVTYFYRQLEYALANVGISVDRLWIDRNKLEPSDNFTIVIKEQLQQTDILIAVLSNGYLSSGWCRDELDYFVSQLQDIPDAERRRRIFRIDKHKVNEAELPEVLRHVQAINLYKQDPADPGFGQEFYYRGKLKYKALYIDAIDKLAVAIAKRVQELGLIERTKGPGWMEAEETIQIPAEKTKIPSNRRTVYVASPAFELEDEYTTLVIELRNRGFTVLPGGDLPRQGGAALKVIRDGLAKAELSIHLLGDKRGFQPEELNDGIVPLQLAEATAQAGRDRSFRRLIWAPKIMPAIVGPEEEIEPGKKKAAAGKRDPLQVLSQFGASLPSDEVEGDTAARFCDFVVQTLSAREEEAKQAASVAIKPSTIYLAFTMPDQKLALETAKRLKEAGARPILSANNSSFSLASRADHAIVCWGAADDLEVFEALDRLAENDWRRLHPNGKLLLLSFNADSDAQQMARDLDSYGAADAVLDGNDPAALALALLQG